MGIRLKTGTDDNESPADNEGDISRKMRVQGAVFIILMCSAILFYWIGGFAENLSPEDVETRNVQIKRNDAADTICFDLCKVRKEKRDEFFGGDLLDAQDLVKMATAAKGKMISRLQSDYSPQHFENILTWRDRAY